MNIFGILIRILLGAILLICSIKDIRTRRISMRIVILGLLILLICIPFRNDLTPINSFIGSFIGFFMIGVGKLSKWQIGMGDGIVLILTGIGIGFWENATLLIYALFFIFLFSVVLLFLKKLSKKTTLPFVPFLFLGYMGVCLSYV